MIVRKQPGFLQLLFAMQGTVVPRVVTSVLCTAVFAALTVAIHRFVPQELPILSGLPLSVMGITLSIFLGFRNKACYDRWWEARNQWGHMIGVTRTFAREVRAIPEHDPEAAKQRRVLLENIGLFTHALAGHLRPTLATHPIRNFFDPKEMPSLEATGNKPDAVLRINAEILADLLHKGHISDIVYQLLDRTLAEFGNVQAACERIYSTPLPFAYSLLLHRTAYLFCFLFPFGFAETLGWFTPFASAIMAYTFFGLDALSEELESPFGDDSHAMPLGGMARTIEISLLEAMGENDIPAPLQAENHILM